MKNFAYMHKRIISAFMKTLKVKLLPQSSLFKKHLTYQGNEIKFPLPLNVLYHLHQKIKLAIGTINHEKIKSCLTDMNQCLTNIFKI